MNGCLLMQVLKDEVRKKILKAATYEFREKGFQNSSMRSIAKRSGMTVGNLYRYFRNKEDLFHTVVSPAFEKIKKLLKEDEGLSFLEENGKSYISEYVTRKIIEIHNEHRNELLIIINGSKETRFEGGKEEVIALLEKRIKSCMFPKLRAMGVIIEDEFLARVIAASYVEGVIIILNNYEDLNKINKQIELYAQFAFKDIEKRFNNNNQS